MLNQYKKYNYFNLSPLIILLWGAFSVAVLPVIQIASGFGWDGVFYGKVALYFPQMAGNMDSYHSGRIYPAVLIHYLLVLLKIPLNVKTILLTYQLYNIIILTFGAYLWVKITNHLNLVSVAKWFGFVALFINYPVLNIFFYYPSLTDVTALVIGIIMLYAYLKNNNLILFIVTSISFFTWPTGIVIGAIIFIYNNIDNNFWLQYRNKIGKFLLIFLLISPLLLIILISGNFDSISSFVVESKLTGKLFQEIGKHNKVVHYSLMCFISSITLIAYLIIIYWILLKDFDFLLFIKANFQKKIFVRILIAIGIVFILSYIKKYLYNPHLPTVTPAVYAYLAAKLSSRFPLQFLVADVAYWGPSMLILLIFIKDFIKFIKAFHLPVFIGFLFTIIFSVNAESRSITNFYPFIIFVLIQSVNFSKINHIKYFIISFVFVSLIYAKIWLITQLPVSTFPKTIESGLDKFPMQWLFMNNGLWMNGQMFILYLITALIFGGFFTLFFGGSKKNNAPAKIY